jgi:hypothetical protein
VEPYLHSPNTPSRCGAQLKEAQGQIYIYLYLLDGIILGHLRINYVSSDNLHVALSENALHLRGES